MFNKDDITVVERGLKSKKQRYEDISGNTEDEVLAGGLETISLCDMIFQQEPDTNSELFFVLKAILARLDAIDRRLDLLEVKHERK